MVDAGQLMPALGKLVATEQPCQVLWLHKAVQAKLRSSEEALMEAANTADRSMLNATLADWH